MGNRYEGSVKARDYELCLLTEFLKLIIYFIINKFMLLKINHLIQV